MPTARAPPLGTLGRTLSRRVLVLSAAAAASMRDVPTRALEVPPSAPRDAADMLYGRAPLEPASFQQQVSDAQPLKHMRGRWRVRERLDDTGSAEGLLTFTGQLDRPEQGEVVLSGAAAAARGRWLLKPDGFGRDAEGRGIIQVKAAWKMRRGDRSYIYSGRVVVPSFTGARPDASIVEGCIDELVDKRSGRTRKVGDFQAELLQLLELDARDGRGLVVDVAPPQSFTLEPAASTREVAMQSLLYPVQAW